MSEQKDTFAEEAKKIEYLKITEETKEKLLRIINDELKDTDICGNLDVLKVMIRDATERTLMKVIRKKTNRIQQYKNEKI